MSSSGATFVNYTSLVADIQRYIERGRTLDTDPDVFEQIPRLINGCERQLIQALKLQGAIEVMNDPSGFTPGTSILEKPDRWRETVSMSYGMGVGNNQRVNMFPRSYEVCRSYWPNDALQDPTQLPLYYSDYDFHNWLIVPTAPAILPVEIICYMQPPLLSDTNQNNFWSEYTPNALLYGALMMSAPFLKNDERLQTWQGLYQFELSTLANQDLQKILDRNSERARP